MKLLALLSLLLLFNSCIKNKKTVLRIYSYSSFSALWGAGPLIKKEFEKTCDCKVVLVGASGGQSLLNRMKLDQKNKSADLVFGLDSFLSDKALQQFQWKKIETARTPFSHTPIVEKNSFFLPISWSFLGFVAHKKYTNTPPINFEGLFKPSWTKKILVPHPETSLLGKYFMIWALQQGKTKEEIYKQVLFLPSWSSTYSYFKQNPSFLVFTYALSPYYHQKEEGNHDFYFISLKEKHPFYVETAGIPSFCRECELAEKFLSFLSSEFAQKSLATKNYMIPYYIDHRFLPLPRVNLLSKEKQDAIYKKLNTAL